MSYPTAIVKISAPSIQAHGKFMLVGYIPESCIDADTDAPRSKIYESEADALGAVLADEWVRSNPRHVIQAEGVSFYVYERISTAKTPRTDAELAKLGGEELTLATFCRQIEIELRQQESVNRAFVHIISNALDGVGAPTHHPDIGAPARKPMMPQERIAALGQQLDAVKTQAVREMGEAYHEADEAIGVLKWVYNDGRGREVTPNDLAGNPFPEWEKMEAILAKHPEGIVFRDCPACAGDMHDHSDFCPMKQVDHAESMAFAIERFRDSLMPGTGSIMYERMLEALGDYRNDRS